MKIKVYMESLNVKEEKIKEKIREINKIKKNKIERIMIEGEPIPTARPRKSKYGGMYVPKAKSNRNKIIKQISKQIDFSKFEIIDSEVHIDIKFYVNIPNNFSNIDKILAELGYIRPLSLPDIDNLVKTYMDALTGLVWLDDGQVSKINSEKFYSMKPRTVINITYLNSIPNSVLRRYAKKKMENYNKKK